MVVPENSNLVGIRRTSCLLLPAVVRYNPQPVLGHLLGQNEADDGAENQPAKRAGGSNDRQTRAPR